MDKLNGVHTDTVLCLQKWAQWWYSVDNWLLTKYLYINTGMKAVGELLHVLFCVHEHPCLSACLSTYLWEGVDQLLALYVCMFLTLLLSFLASSPHNIFPPFSFFLIPNPVYLFTDQIVKTAQMSNWNHNHCTSDYIYHSTKPILLYHSASECKTGNRPLGRENLCSRIWE